MEKPDSKQTYTLDRSTLHFLAKKVANSNAYKGSFPIARPFADIPQINEDQIKKDFPAKSFSKLFLEFLDKNRDKIEESQKFIESCQYYDFDQLDSNELKDYFIVFAANILPYVVDEKNGQLKPELQNILIKNPSIIEQYKEAGWNIPEVLHWSLFSEYVSIHYNQFTKTLSDYENFFFSKIYAATIGNLKKTISFEHYKVIQTIQNDAEKIFSQAQQNKNTGSINRLFDNAPLPSVIYENFLSSFKKVIKAIPPNLVNFFLSDPGVEINLDDSNLTVFKDWILQLAKFIRTYLFNEDNKLKQEIIYAINLTDKSKSRYETACKTFGVQKVNNALLRGFFSRCIQSMTKNASHEYVISNNDYRSLIEYSLLPTKIATCYRDKHISLDALKTNETFDNSNRPPNSFKEVVEPIDNLSDENINKTLIANQSITNNVSIIFSFDDISIPESINNQFFYRLKEAIDNIPDAYFNEFYQDIEKPLSLDNSNLEKYEKFILDLSLVAKNYLFDQNGSLKPETITLINGNNPDRNLYQEALEIHGIEAIKNQILKSFISVWIQGLTSKLGDKYKNPKTKQPDERYTFLPILIASTFIKVINITNLKNYEDYPEYQKKPETKAATVLAGSFAWLIEDLSEINKRLENKIKKLGDIVSEQQNLASSAILEERPNSAKTLAEIKLEKLQQKYQAVKSALLTIETKKTELENKIRNLEPIDVNKDIKPGIEAYRTTVQVTLTQVLKHTSPLFEKINNAFEKVAKIIRNLLSRKVEVVEDIESESNKTEKLPSLFFKTKTYKQVEKLQKGSGKVIDIIERRINRLTSG